MLGLHNLFISPPAFCPEFAHNSAAPLDNSRSVAKTSTPKEAKNEGSGSVPTAKPKPLFPGINIRLSSNTLEI